MTHNKRQTAVVICPGRGSYNKSELGYLQHHHKDKQHFIDSVDHYRSALGQPSIATLDSEPQYRLSVHTPGDNASALIFTCAVADYFSINQNKFDIVAITGNSMGWYLALACAGALTQENAIHLVNTMGTLMHDNATGGQIIYPLVNDNWQSDPALEQAYTSVIAQARKDPQVDIYESIILGGMRVIAANNKGIKTLLDTLPHQQGRYPLALPYHSAFHSPIMQPIALQAQAQLPSTLFTRPALPLIDGRGTIWQSHTTDLQALYRYTLGHQLTETYHYSKSIEVAVKEFAPDKLIILGPGSTLGPPTMQILLQCRWQGMATKNAIKSRQSSDPFILAMGIAEQRSVVI